MSSTDRDPSRKVSKPTQKDFLHGMSAGYGQHNGGPSSLLVLAAGLLLGRRGKRGER